MSDDRDLARIIEPLARHFFGPPNRKLSTKTNLRFGNHGSLSVDGTSQKASGPITRRRRAAACWTLSRP